MTETTQATAARELDELSLARAKRGDQRACLAFVELYSDRVFALLRRVVGRSRPAATVEDLAQETFLRVFRSLDDFVPGPRARLSTWILTIATRLAIDELRRPAAAVDEGKVSFVDPSAELESRDMSRRVLRAVADLPVEYRAAFVLRAFHELSYDEIGTTLMCDVGTVKSRISRARTSLRAAIEGAAS